MGLFSKLGVGGGKLAIEVGDTPLRGDVVFTGGKRAQNINSVKAWLAQTKIAGKGGNVIVVAPLKLAGEGEIAAGEVKRFFYELHAPAGLAATKAGETEYAIFAAADIEGEIDLQVHAPVTI
jgi:hypothetical protein